MSYLCRATAALIALSTALPAFAEVTVVDPYARAASPSAKAGASFMKIMNSGAEDDTLIAVSSPAAKRVELHTHIEEGGLMKMVQIEGGIPVPASSMTMLKRGGNHVMLMGLTGPLEQGAQISVTLVFEKAGEMVVTVPVDNLRKPGAMDHGSGHGN